MSEFYALRYLWLVLRTRLDAVHDEERGITTLEIVLWIAGLGVLAIATLVVITDKVTDATNKIPTGPTGP
jgi:hypothetical protein